MPIVSAKAADELAKRTNQYLGNIAHAPSPDTVVGQFIPGASYSKPVPLDEDSPACRCSGLRGSGSCPGGPYTTRTGRNRAGGAFANKTMTIYNNSGTENTFRFCGCCLATLFPGHGNCGEILGQGDDDVEILEPNAQVVVSGGDVSKLREMVEKDHIIIGTLPIGPLKESITNELILIKKSRYLSLIGEVNNRGSPHIGTDLEVWQNKLKPFLEKKCPTIWRLIQDQAKKFNADVGSGGLTYYFPEGNADKVPGGRYGFGVHEYHHDKNFCYGAKLRVLISLNNTDDGKKMYFQDKYDGRWFKFEVPHGTVVIFSDDGAGTEKCDRRVFKHCVEGAGGGYTLLFELILKS